MRHEMQINEKLFLIKFIRSPWLYRSRWIKAERGDQMMMMMMTTMIIMMMMITTAIENGSNWQSPS